MTPDLSNLIALAFGAGTAWFAIKQGRKDVNGLGSKVNNDIKQSARQHHNTCLAIMVLAKTDEDKALVADLLKEP